MSQTKLRLMFTFLILGWLAFWSFETLRYLNNPDTNFYIHFTTLTIVIILLLWMTAIISNLKDLCLETQNGIINRLTDQRMKILEENTQLLKNNTKLMKEIMGLKKK